MASVKIPSEPLSSSSCLEPCISERSECRDSVKDNYAELISLGFQLTLLVEEEKNTGMEFRASEGHLGTYETLLIKERRYADCHPL